MGYQFLSYNMFYKYKYTKLISSRNKIGVKQAHTRHKIRVNNQTIWNKIRVILLLVYRKSNLSELIFSYMTVSF